MSTAKSTFTTGVLLALSACSSIAGAQGVTSAGVHGKVSGPDRAVSPRLSIRHDATGFSADVPVNQGRYFIQNLEPGGPYTITVRAVGFTPLQRRNVFLALGEMRVLDFVLNPVGVVLDTVTIVASDGLRRSGTHADGGTGMTISSSQLERLPTLNRDLYDFVRLVPQISTKISLANPGLSATGSGFRFNNFLINGVSDRTLSGSVSNAFSGNRSISLDAVKEYQVLLAPYDVRYGDFAGALVNAVTKSGTNDLRGSVFVYGRSDALARPASDTLIAPYERLQYGLSLGGPIVRNRIHYFLAAELQQFTSPAPGPYVGQPDDADTPVPVSLGDLERFDSIMRSYGLSAGSAGAIENSNPLRNVYGRIDIALPSLNTRAVVSHNYAGSNAVAFSRAMPRGEFPLSSTLITSQPRSRMTALRVHTTFLRAGGGDNELLVSVRRDALRSMSIFEQPVIRVLVPAISGGGRVTLNSGTSEAAQGSGFRSSAVAVKDNITIALGSAHIVTAGAELERFRIRQGNPQVTYGAWTFASLEDLALGVADRYDVRLNFENADVPLTGTQYAGYVSDRWLAADGLTITAGVRADRLAIDGHAPYNPAIESLFGRRTDQMPRARIELSPRLGFQWEVSGTERHQIRGGLGVFTGRYPLAWAHAALSAYGVGGTLTCTRSGAGRGLPPVFTTSHRTPPTACLGGSTITDSGDVNLLDRNLRMMRTLRGSLAYDRHLSPSLILTNEGVFSSAMSDFIAVNLNLPDPAGSDVHGRVIYGSFLANGGAIPGSRSGAPGFGEVIDLRNTSRNYSYSLSTRLEKTQTLGLSGFLSYTWSRARDVQTLTRVNNRGTVLWGSARVTSGRHDNLEADISSNDIPRRVILAGTYARRMLRGRAEASFYYVGESGRPFTYVASGTQLRGDLNADGSNINDPIYIPTDAHDTTQIRFSGMSALSGADNSPAAQASRVSAQQSAFESLIERMPCMRNQRGRILERNSCREPWTNTTIASVRHAIPVARRSLELEVQVYNFLNLLNRDWGHRRQAAPPLLEHVSQTAAQGGTSMPVFRFNTDSPDWIPSPVESSFQLQLALRYRI